ncbi:MAG: helix-turn-helix domain-containing protein, partial [Pseudonocardiaceae bacterium]
MGYGHADNLARGGAQRGEQKPETTKAERPGALAPDWYAAPGLVPVLTGHDIGALFRWLNDAGVVQRRIAVLTGSSQSQIADIMTGRRARVQVYEVLARIAEGLAVPPERMGLSWWGPDGRWYGPPGAYPGGVPVTDAEGAAEVLRRRFEHLLALGAAAAMGGLVPGVGELDADLPVPALPGGVPSRIGMVDVGVLRGYRENLRTMARTYGGQAGAAVALTDWADQWLTADTSETVRRALLGELAGLHTTTAWCCHDCGAPARALYHFGRAVELATGAGDAYQVAYALRFSAMMLVDRGRHNDALKAIQFGSVRLLDAPRDDPRVPVLGAECEGMSALALSRLDDSPSVRA